MNAIKSRLKYYFKRSFVANQIPWDWENDQEIEELVEMLKKEIIDEVMERMEGRLAGHGFGRHSRC